MTVNTIKHHKLASLFDNIITLDDVEFGKPSPDGLVKILQNTSTDCRAAIFFGDSDVDRIASINAGIDFYLHTSGYNDCKNNVGIKFQFSKYQELLKIGKFNEYL